MSEVFSLLLVWLCFHFAWKVFESGVGIWPSVLRHCLECQGPTAERLGSSPGSVSDSSSLLTCTLLGSRDGSGTWVPASHKESWLEFPAPGFGPLAIRASGKCSLSHSLPFPKKVVKNNLIRGKADCVKLPNLLVAEDQGDPSALSSRSCRTL